MSKYDKECFNEFSALKKRVDKYFINVTVSCPYNLPYQATFNQGLFGPLSDRMMELFLAAGYRRNGNSLYSMRCASCQACVPIRLHPTQFTASRTQKKVWRKNNDIDISIGMIQPSRESLDLCEKFLRDRYPYEGNSAEAYYSGFFLNRIISTFEFRYRLEGKLIGNGVVDIGQRWLNAVYFFFDQEYARRSLGVFNILTLIQFCLNKEIEYLYLGYNIDEISSMNYKKRFKPHYLYHEGSWIQGK